MHDRQASELVGRDGRPRGLDSTGDEPGRQTSQDHTSNRSALLGVVLHRLPAGATLAAKRARGGRAVPAVGPLDGDPGLEVDEPGQEPHRSVCLLVDQLGSGDGVAPGSEQRVGQRDRRTLDPVRSSSALFERDRVPGASAEELGVELGAPEYLATVSRLGDSDRGGVAGRGALDTPAGVKPASEEFSGLLLVEATVESGEAGNGDG